jgi:hypothetical protein
MAAPNEENILNPFAPKRRNAKEMTPTAGAVLERHRARMHGADELMRRRSAIVEHPFGTLKCRAGYRHFLVRGFNKVRGEWSLMALCYNFTRVLNIMGFERFVAYVAKVLLSRLRASGAPLGPGLGFTSSSLSRLGSSLEWLNQRLRRERLR